MVFYELDDRHVTDLLGEGLKHVREAVARPVAGRSSARQRSAR